MTPPAEDCPIPQEERRVHNAIVDPRIDKAVSWLLMFVAGLALSVGAYFFSGLQKGMDDLRRDVATLGTALARTEADRRDIDALRREVDSLRDKLFTELEKRGK